MSTHTPGPWQADAMCRDSSVEPRNCQVKAFHAGDSLPMKRIATCYYGATDGERQANAALIAAAPDLLAALEQVIQEADAAWFLEHPTARICKAAIAKAKGQPV